MVGKLKLDEIGFWSEVKLEIVKKYAAAYSIILAKQASLKHVYIDAFAGAGVHISKETRDFVPGSPLNALNIEPPFCHYYFVDLKKGKINLLKNIVGDRNNVDIFMGDCNVILKRDVFPQVRYEDYKRALCLLDPYGLHLNWDVIQGAGQMKTIEIFLNFPIMDMNMNVLWSNKSQVQKAQIERMNLFWGDKSWQSASYTEDLNLFNDTIQVKKQIRDVMKAFQRRLKEVAGFRYVPEPIPMRNKTRGLIYYLFFASQYPVAKAIVEDIFNRYRRKGWN